MRIAEIKDDIVVNVYDTHKKPIIADSIVVDITGMDVIVGDNYINDVFSRPVAIKSITFQET